MTDKTETSARASRTSTTREQKTRSRPWKPPSSLDAPEAPEGYTHRWVRHSIMGHDDTKNLAASLREGFELVRADEYPDFDAPTIQDGKHAGVIGVGGLILARFPTDTEAQRKAYYAQKTADQQSAIDNDMLREQHPSMPISKPDRQSRVTFGGKATD